ncbi:MAG: Flp pilus assembly complex ATPase component TadA [Syntrophaceae bacterium]|nr:Flp pilus assembly complex ATPase component TadA [Syntrophaceae bacterium]
MPGTQSSAAVILCIDDNRDSLNLLERILKGAGYAVITAADGPMGITEAQKTKPDLILLDVIMPGMDGYNVCSYLQKNPETAYIPVIFLTALDGEADRTKAFAVGAVDYLVKPVSKDILLAKTDEQLKTRVRWKKLKEDVTSNNLIVHPANFPRFKQSLVDRLDLSKKNRDAFMATSPPDIYKICGLIGIPERQMTAWMADYLSLQILSPINPAHLLLGIIPASFARENHVVAMEDEKTGRSFILSNPFDWMLFDTLKKFFGLQPAMTLYMAEPKHIELLFEQPADSFSKPSESRSGKPAETKPEPAADITSADVGKGPIVTLANNILSTAVYERASDIHIEPKVDQTLVRFRIDGDMRDMYSINNATGIMLISRLKAISGLDITERRKPQDGAVETVIAGRTFKIRLATTSTPAGESLIARLLEPDIKAKELQTLGMTDDQVRMMIDFSKRHQGLVMIVGPTGSGKTTTIYSLLSNIDCRTRSLISVEDPVEYRLPFANQQQVNEKGGVSFDTLLKSSVRQDPDILFIGEVRDNLSARIAMDFASTGHLTISTIHTSNATTAIFRLERLGVSRGIMADSVIAIVAQRLIKKLCPACRAVKPISDQEREQLRPFTTEMPSETAHPVGCPQCNQVGYFGREAVYEIINFDSDVVDMVRAEKSISDIRSFIQQRGDYLISHHAIDKIRNLTMAVKDVYEKILLEERIPIKSKPAKPDAADIPGEERSKTILLVEDDEDTQKLIGRILESADYNVTMANDGLAALACLEQKHYDLILSDINMPNLDGFKLIEIINQKGITAPIIFLTGSTSEQDEIHAFELGATDYIVKPVKRKELLLSRVRNALSKTENRRGSKPPVPDREAEE